MGGGGVSCAEAERATMAAPHTSSAVQTILRCILLFINFAQLSLKELAPCQKARIAIARDGLRAERFQHRGLFLRWEIIIPGRGGGLVASDVVVSDEWLGTFGEEAEWVTVGMGVLFNDLKKS